LSKYKNKLLKARFDGLTISTTSEEAIFNSKEEMLEFINFYFFLGLGVHSIKPVKDLNYTFSYQLKSQGIYIEYTRRKTGHSLYVSFQGAYLTIQGEDAMKKIRSKYFELSSFTGEWWKVSNIHIASDMISPMEPFEDLFIKKPSIKKINRLHNNFLTKFTKVFPYINPLTKDVETIYCKSSKWQVVMYDKTIEMNKGDEETQTKTFIELKKQKQYQYYKEMGLDVDNPDFKITRIELRLSAEYLVNITETLQDLLKNEDFNETEFISSIQQYWYKRHCFYKLSNRQVKEREQFSVKYPTKRFSSKETLCELDFWKAIFNPDKRVVNKVKSNDAIRFSAPRLKTKEEIVEKLPLQIGLSECLNYSDTEKAVDAFREIQEELREKYNEQVQRYEKWKNLSKMDNSKRLK
jgi:hypothetical protein